MNRFITKCLLGVAICAAINQSVAQQPPVPLFKSNDKVCFVGNSITQSGGFQHFIYLYHVTRFPDEKVSFFNCGVGGDVAPNILKRLDEDVFINKPTHLMLMVGMNDVNRSLYSKISADQAIEKKKAVALDNYRHNVEEILRRFNGYHAQVTLFKPSIYDQTSTIPTENMLGVNNALEVCGTYLQELSQKYKTKLVDFWSILETINRQQQLKDPQFTIVGNDRIHPGFPGHFVMAYQFLKTRNAASYVSKIKIYQNKEEDSFENINCKVDSLKIQSDAISFNCIEGSLPFPIQKEAELALKLVPFTEDFNKQILQINGLKQGVYDLLIDDYLVNTYSSNQLESGVNLALNKNTPQYHQALTVLDACLHLKELQAQLRLLKRVEYRELQQATSPNNLDSVKLFLATHLEKNYKNRYEYNKQLFYNYLLYKPREAEINKAVQQAQAYIYTLNKPVFHRYLIVKR